MSNFEIRRCTIDDLPAILAMQDAVLEENKKKNKECMLIKTDEEQLEAYLFDPHLTLGFFDEGGLFGYIVMSRYEDDKRRVQGNVGKKFDFLLDIQGDIGPNEPCEQRNQIAYIELILIQEDHRRKKKSTDLIKAMEDEVRKREGFKFMATMACPCNSASVGTFTKSGFVKHEIVINPKTGYPRLLLYKQL